MTSPDTQSPETRAEPTRPVRDYTALVEQLFCHEETSPFPGFHRARR